MATGQRSPSRIVTLEGDLDTASIHWQWQQAKVLLCLDGGQAAIDLTRIEHLDELGVQLLCTLEVLLKAKGIAFKVVGAKLAWQADFKAMGVDRLMTGGRP